MAGRDMMPGGTRRESRRAASCSAMPGNEWSQHDHPRLHRKAMFITVTFADQKNRDKKDSRTHQRSLDPTLCPVLRWASAVQRIIATITDHNDDTPMCSAATKQGTVLITSDFARDLLRHACAAGGGKSTFGMHPEELGNKSIRSGAAMALFLMDHSTAKIMTLGRWKSNAFLAYICPQVLEWTNQMSHDMVHLDSFLDMSHQHVVATSDPRPPQATPKLQWPGFVHHNAKATPSPLTQTQNGGSIEGSGGKPEPKFGLGFSALLNSSLV